MKNEFGPYDIALAMEELGWGKENTMYYAYSRATKNLYPHRFEFPKDKGKLIKAPLYQQAFRWFRDEYDLDGETCRYNLSHSEAKFLGIDITKTKHRYLVVINGEDFPNLEDMTLFISREEAELACLRKLIEIVKEKRDEK